MLLQYILVAALVAQGCLAKSFTRITDAEEAPPHQFPYEVSIGVGIPILKYKHICGGAIINRDWILTAAHCVKLIPTHILGVQAGKHIIHQHEAGEQFSGVSLKVIHWKYSVFGGQYDIALLRLKTSLEINKIVAPIRLPKSDEIHTGTAVISGWGSDSKDLKPHFPEVLQTATVKILNNEQCNRGLHEFPGDVKLSNTQLCTGPLYTTISVCWGDGGSPLVQYDDDAIPELVGIVSHQLYSCGHGAPSIYTRVSSYVEWINDKLNN